MDIKEITALWDKLNEIERKLSKYYDDKHSESTEGIKANQEGLFDLAELSANNQEGEFDLAEVVSDLLVRVETLEGQANG